jgi:hypothetical protein
MELLYLLEVKFALENAMKAQRSSPHPWLSLYRRLCGPQERFGRVRKIFTSPGFDPRTVQGRSASLYRMRYPGPRIQFKYIEKKRQRTNLGKYLFYIQCKLIFNLSSVRDITKYSACGYMKQDIQGTRK